MKKRRFTLTNKIPSEFSESLKNFITQMDISTSYFDICKYLFDIYDNDIEKYSQISEQAISHIFRSFIIIIHILPIQIRNNLHDQKDQLSDLIIDSLPYYLDFFIKLKNDQFIDGLYLIELFFHKIFHFFPQICTNTTSPFFNKFPDFINSTISIIAINQLTTSNSISPFIEFIGQFFQCWFATDSSEKK